MQTIKNLNKIASYEIYYGYAFIGNQLTHITAIGVHRILDHW